MKTKLAIMFAAAGAMLVPPMWAHHAFTSEFDGHHPIKLQGVVKKMEWINPHAWIHLDVKDASGNVNTWMIECGTPNTLLRKGLTKTSVVPGTEILVEGYQAKSGKNVANGRDVTFTDGRKLFLGSSNPSLDTEKK